MPVFHALVSRNWISTSGYAPCKAQLNNPHTCTCTGSASNHWSLLPWLSWWSALCLGSTPTPLPCRKPHCWHFHAVPARWGCGTLCWKWRDNARETYWTNKTLARNLPEQFIVSRTISTERVDEISIYDAETLQPVAQISFPSFPIFQIQWNSERSSFIASNGHNDGCAYWIFKRVPKNRAK